MTEERLALAELLEKAGEGDFLRAVAEAVLQLLMEADVEGLIGAGRYVATADPKIPAGQLFPAVSRSPQEFGEGAGRGDPRSLDRRPLAPRLRSILDAFSS